MALEFELTEEKDAQPLFEKISTLIDAQLRYATEKEEKEAAEAAQKSKEAK